MKNVNCNTTNKVIRKRLAEMRLSEHDRQLAVSALHDAEAIVDAVIWVRQGIAQLGALLLKPGFKH